MSLLLTSLDVRDGARIAVLFLGALLQSHKLTENVLRCQGTYYAFQSSGGMRSKVADTMVGRLPGLLRELREARQVSMRVLADEAKIDVSVVSRAERGRDARLSTWEKLFSGLGYRLDFQVSESSEEGPELPAEEAERRRVRRWLGLCRTGRGW